MSDLTLEKMLATMREIEKIAPRSREPGILDFLRPPQFAGLKVYEAPPPPPKIVLRDINLDDGTSILSPEFRAQMQSWLTARFGFQEDLFAFNAYTFGNSIIMSPKHIAMIRNLA